MRVLFVGGGSIGHVAPCVAVWRALQMLSPGAQGMFICADREDEMFFLKNEDLEYIALPVPRLRPSFPFMFLRAFSRTKSVIASWKPDVLLCKGGAISVPAAFAAYRRRIPFVLHESDMVSGRAVSLLSRFAATTCIGFPTAKISGDRMLHTGNPIRPEIAQGTKNRGYAITGFSGKKKIILVMGGSQGSEALNNVVMTHLSALLSLCDVIHITGRGKKAAPPRAGYWSTNFAQDSLPHLYAIADLALSRSGAGSIGELAACSIPSILVPLRGVGHDHQYANATAVSASGGCLQLEQSELNSRLLDTASKLLRDESTLEIMSRKIHMLHAPNAAANIAQVLLEIASKSA